VRRQGQRNGHNESTRVITAAILRPYKGVTYAQ
jgi:hypothetical protein